MLCRVNCACCNGLEVVDVTVEVAVSEGVQMYLVGLPDNAIKESQQRIQSALEAYGFRIPGKKIVVNLAPANIRKGGSAFDAAIAVGILSASRQIPSVDLSRYIILGELALDGSMRSVPGALPIIIHAKECGKQICILPPQSALEGSEIDGIKVYSAATLRDVIDIICGRDGFENLLVETSGGASLQNNPSDSFEYDFADVKGQRSAKIGLEIAAAGGHNVVMVGSPGCGKTFMAKCLQRILPPLTKEESIETSKIYSVAGLLESGSLMRQRPFRSPHHTITIPALVGGGNRGMPGEISLAHNGVLFCDEFAEFDRKVMDVMRQPLEDGVVQISRVREKIFYPARFMFVAAMNPCPCGLLYDEPGKCKCATSAVQRYRGKISGPVYDRIDINLRVKRVRGTDLVVAGTDAASSKGMEEHSAVIAERVLAARKIQSERYLKNGESFHTNASIPPSKLQIYCALGREESLFMRKIVSATDITARGYGRVLKIARTVADLESARLGGDPLDIKVRHLSVAIRMRSSDTGSVENY